jgi:predicted Rossmann fold nucleotide-binding protein DprA/Smf involved in DNA uptake
LKNKSPYYVQVGRTRRIGEGDSRTKVYKFIRYSEDLIDFVNNEKEVSECPYFFSNLCAHARELNEGMEKSTDTWTKGSSTKNLTKRIKEFITNQQQELVEKEEIIEKIDKDEQDIEQKLIDMEEDGLIFEPKPGKVKKL